MLSERMGFNVIASQLPALKPRFPGHGGTLTELSFAIQGKQTSVLSLAFISSSHRLSVVACVVELTFRCSVLKTSFLIFYLGNRLGDVSCLKLPKLKAWKDNQVKEECQFIFLFVLRLGHKKSKTI